MRDGREGGRETTPEVLQFAVGQTGSPGLDEDVADGSWLNRAGGHGSPGPYGDERAQQGVLAPAAGPG